MGEKLNSITTNLLEGASDTEEKLERIYYYVPSKLRLTNKSK